MARIPEAEIERLKSEISVERLVEASGIELARHGADRVGRCPFHADRTPSLVVSPAKNLWHCLGACQTGGCECSSWQRGVCMSLPLFRSKASMSSSGYLRLHLRWVSLLRFLHYSRCEYGESPP